MSEPVTIYMVTEGHCDVCGDNVNICAFVREQDAKEACAQGLGDNVDELRLYPAGQLPAERTLYWEATARVANAMPSADQVPSVREVRGWDFEGIHSGPPRVNVYSGGHLPVPAMNPPARVNVRATDQESALAECCKQYEALVKMREDKYRTDAENFLGDRRPFDAR